MMAFDGQDATQGRLDVFWSMWQCAGIIWHVWQLAGALEGPTFCLLDADLAQNGPWCFYHWKVLQLGFDKLFMNL
jgi:hypothetical protein